MATTSENEPPALKRQRVSESGRSGKQSAQSAESSGGDRHRKAGNLIGDAIATQIPDVLDETLVHYLDGYFIKRHSHEPAISTGGFGDIYRGTHPVFGLVAMKHPRLAGNKNVNKQIKSLRDEATLWGRLIHLNILPFIGLIQSDAHIWLISPFAANGSLDRYIEAHPQTDRVKMVLELASGLAYLHRQGIVHGDIKGNNVLISADIRVLLSDFGLAKLSDTGVGSASSYGDGGNARWAAPEIMMGERRTSASDLYAFGTTISQILSGKIPFSQYGAEVAVITAVIVRKERPVKEPLSSDSGQPYDWLWDISEKCWDPEPEKRPDMEAVLSALGLQKVPESIPDDLTRLIVSVSGHTLPAPGTNVVRPAIPQGTAGAIHHHGPSYDNRQRVGEMPRARARHDSSLRGGAEGCFEGTQVQNLRKVFDWIDDTSNDARSIYWLSGAAGTGKSTIAQTVAEYAESRHILGASFFFSRADADRQDAGLFFPTIAYQLALFNPKILKRLAEVLRSDVDVVHSKMLKQMQELIIGPLQALDVEPPRTIVVVVDGLDECSSPSDMETMLQLWTQCAKALRHRIRLFVTSRPHWHIAVTFKTSILQNMSITFSLNDTDKAVLMHDVDVYLRYHLGRIAVRHDLQTWPSEEEHRALVTKTDGFFILAATAIRALDSPDAVPDEQLRAFLAPSSDGSSTNPLSELDTLYTQILNTLVSETSSGNAVDEIILRYHLIVGSVILLRAPMAPKDLEELLHTTPRTATVALRRLQSVIVLPPIPTLPIHIVHASFPEFLMDPSRCEDARFAIDEQTGHGTLARHCLALLNTALKHNICGIEDPTALLSEVEDLSDRLDRDVSLALRYAAIHFAAHLSKASSEDDVLAGQVEEFCERKLLFWLEVLALTQKTKVATEALSAVRDWYHGLPPRPQSQRILNLLHDGRRFSLRFGELISSAPQQIYLSALGFTPDCVLRDVYIKDALPWFVLGWEDTWSDTLWHTSTGHLGFPILSHSSRATNLGVLPTLVDGPGIVQIWDSNSNTLGTTLATEFPYSLIAMAPDGSHLVAVPRVEMTPSGDRLAEVIHHWDISLGTVTLLAPLQLGTNSNAVKDVLVGHDGSYVALAFVRLEGFMDLLPSSQMTHIDVRSLASGDLMQRFECDANSFALSPDGRYIVTASADHFDLWDRHTGLWARTFGSGNNLGGTGNAPLARLPRYISFLPCGVRCAALVRRGTWSIEIYDVESGGLLHVLQEDMFSGTTLLGEAGFAVSPNGVIACPGLGAMTGSTLPTLIRLYDTRNLGSSWSVKVEQNVGSLSFNENGSMLAAGHLDGSFRILGTQGSRAVEPIPLDPLDALLKNLQLGDGTSNAEAEFEIPRHGDTDVIRWKFEHKTRILHLKGQSGLEVVITLDEGLFADAKHVCRVSVSPDATRVAFVSVANHKETHYHVWVYDIPTNSGKRLGELTPTPRTDSSSSVLQSSLPLTFTPARDIVPESHPAKQWLHPDLCFGGGTQIQFSGSGDTVYLAFEGRILFWDAANGELTLTFESDSYTSLRSVLLSPDEAHLLLIGHSNRPERDFPHNLGDDDVLLLTYPSFEPLPTTVSEASFIQFDAASNEPRYLVWGQWLELITSSMRQRLLWIPAEWRDLDELQKRRSSWVGPFLTVKSSSVTGDKHLRIDLERLMNVVSL